MFINLLRCSKMINTIILDLAKKFEEREKEFQKELSEAKSAPNEDNDKIGLLESQIEDLEDLVKSKQRFDYFVVGLY